MEKNRSIKLLISMTLKKLLKSKRYDDITIREIAEGCAISRRTFYNHFKNKQDIVDWIFETEILGRLQTPTKNSWYDNIYFSLKVMYEEKWFYTEVYREFDLEGHWGHCYDFSQYAFGSLIDTYPGGTVIDPVAREYISNFFSAGYVHTLYKWVQHGMRETPEYMTQLILHVVEDGIFRIVETSRPPVEMN